MLEIYDDIVDIVAAALEKTPAEVRGSPTLEDIDMDSLDLMDVVMTCEQVFDVRIKDDELNGIETLSQLVALIESHVRQQ